MGVDTYLNWKGRPERAAFRQGEPDDAPEHPAEWSGEIYVHEFLSMLDLWWPHTLAHCGAQQLWHTAAYGEEVPLRGLAEVCDCLVQLLETFDPIVHPVQRDFEAEAARFKRKWDWLRRWKRPTPPPAPPVDNPVIAGWVANELRRLAKSLRLLEVEGVERVNLTLE